MKKISKSQQAPVRLASYLQQNTVDTWKDFRNNDQDGLEEVQTMLRLDQRGICAYCENKLSMFHGNGLDDFRVEHFHPKKRPPSPPPNWDLDWNNLLAVCTGGNAKFIGDPHLFTSPDYSCDVPKADMSLIGIILNPTTDIPTFPPLFEFNELGEMTVSANCPVELKNQAAQTINRLRLSPTSNRKIPNPRLIRFRKAVIDRLREQIQVSIQSGLSLSDASTELAKAHFTTESDWPAFFSTIRWYLGPAAESRLNVINYQG